MAVFIPGTEDQIQAAVAAGIPQERAAAMSRQELSAAIGAYARRAKEGAILRVVEARGLTVGAEVYYCQIVPRAEEKNPLLQVDMSEVLIVTGVMRRDGDVAVKGSKRGRTLVGAHLLVRKDRLDALGVI